MQFLSIRYDTTLSELADIVGDKNVETILVANNLKRTPNIGREFENLCNQSVKNVKSSVDVQRKVTLLNTLTGDSDVFETASLMSEEEWKLFSSLGTFPGMLKIPESIVLPDSVDVLGNNSGVNNITYKRVMDCLKMTGTIDPSIFNEYSSIKNSQIVNRDGYSSYDTFQYFKIPWGKVSLHSSIDNETKDFPVYPEEPSDGATANYTQMPDMLYQYEPWQVYQSSGPRQNTYSFNFHRDMWSGDHKDGKANELIRFCEANCYPEYNGSAVNASIVTLYIDGKPLISGVLTHVDVSWSGPLGHDNWYLVCKLELTIVEVSKTALDYRTVKNKGLIG